MQNEVEFTLGTSQTGEGKLSHKEEIFGGGLALLALFGVYLFLSAMYGKKKSDSDTHKNP